jgi:eukaryotic-like serine/threonine-protein kinase
LGPVHDTYVPGAPPEAATEEDPPPARLSRYEVRGRIAAGGMGKVYEAYDPQLQRRVALKVLRSELLDTAGREHWRARLLREAQAMARLSHPNVLAVHDAGSEGERVFIAMDLVEGETLTEWAAATPHPWRAVLAVMLQAGEGLAAAHRAGLIHRDFKPSNVLVDRSGRALVLDFGLAAATSSAEAPPQPPDSSTSVPPTPARTSSGDALTIPGIVMGTPGFMAPEQLEGRPTDVRGDQFSFCATFYEVLHRIRAYPGTTIDEYRHSLREVRLTALPRWRQVPDFVHRALLRGLQLQPEARFPSMDALLVELRRDPASARRRWVGRAAVAAAVLAVPTTLWVERRSRACRSAEQELADTWGAERAEAVSRAFLATGKNHAAETARRVREQLDDWSAKWVAARREACVATRVSGEQSEDDLQLRLRCLDARRDDLAALVQVFAGADAQVVDQAATASAELPALRPCADLVSLRAPDPLPADQGRRRALDVMRGEVSMLQALNASGRYQTGVDLGTPLLVRARAAGYPPLLASALLAVGSLQGEAGALDAAAANLEEAVRVADAARDDRTRAQAALALADLVGRRRARYQDGLRALENAAAVVSRAGDDHELRGSLEYTRSTLLWKLGQLPEALSAGERALAERQKALGPNHPLTANVRNNLGNIQQAMGHLEQALAQYQSALASLEAALGPEHPAVALALNNAGAVLWDMGRLEDARARFERSVQIRERALGPSHPAVARSLINLGAVEQSLGRLPEAARDLARAVQIEETTLGAEHLDLVPGLVNLAGVLLEQGKHAEALERCRRADAINRKELGPEHHDVAYAQTCQAEALVGLGRAAEAVPLAEHAIKLLGSKPVAAEIAEAELALASALWDGGGDRRRAVELGRTAVADYQRGGEAHRVKQAAAWLVAHER